MAFKPKMPAMAKVMGPAKPSPTPSPYIQKAPRMKPAGSRNYGKGSTPVSADAGTGNVGNAVGFSGLE